jgi:hypothetical protein
VNDARGGEHGGMPARSRTVTRRTRILGADRQAPGADLSTQAAMPPVAQTGAVRSGAARRHLAGLNAHDRAQPTSSGGGLLFLALLMVVGVIVVLALAGTGNL